MRIVTIGIDLTKNQFAIHRHWGHVTEGQITVSCN